MMISVPAASQPASTNTGNANPEPNLDKAAPGDATVERFSGLFAQMLTQSPAQLPIIVMDDTGAESPPTDQTQQSLKEESDKTADTGKELPGMTAPLVLAFLSPQQPAPQLAAADSASMKSTTPDAVRTANVKAELNPRDAMPTMKLIDGVGIASPHASIAEASEAVSRAVDAGTPVATALDAHETVNERSASIATVLAPAWSPPISLGAEAAPAVRLAGPSSQWQQPLRQALGDQLQIQVARGSEQAVIRLSPPMMGHIDIAIRHEGGALQVNMSATNNEVMRQLQVIGDSLRHDLMQRQYNDVSVVITQQARHSDGEGRQRQQAEQREQQPGRALGDADQGNGAFAFLTNKE